MNGESHRTITRRGLYGYEINRILLRVRAFIGVFARDEIILPKKFPAFSIVNTDVSKGPGEHWVAIGYFKSHIEYFDSFGLPPMHSCFTKGYKKVRWNSTCIQSFNSLVCGYYCILYVFLRSKGLSYKSIIKKFSKTDLKNNTSTLFNLLEKYGLRWK